MTKTLREAAQAVADCLGHPSMSNAERIKFLREQPHLDDGLKLLVSADALLKLLETLEAPQDLAVLAWVGRDENHDKVGIRSVGTEYGVLPACMVDNEVSQEALARPAMRNLMQMVTDHVSEPQRLIRFVAAETLQELTPMQPGGSHEPN
jgi:hypothetical protein